MMYEGDVVTEFLDALHVVRREDEGCPLGFELEDLPLAELGIDGVKATEGFVEDEELGFVKHRRDELNLLLHPFGELLDTLLPPGHDL